MEEIIEEQVVDTEVIDAPVSEPEGIEEEQPEMDVEGLLGIRRTEEPSSEENAIASLPEVFNGLPENYRPPQFQSIEEKAEWYEANYPKMLEHLNSDEYVNSFIEKYEKFIEEKEIKSSEKYDLMQAGAALLEGNPSLALKMFTPKEHLVELGYSSVFTESDIAAAQRQEIIDQHGSDALTVYNEDAAKNDPTSLSARILKTAQGVAEAMQKENQQRIAWENSMKVLPKEKVIENMKKDYYPALKAKHVSEAKFNEFAERITSEGFWTPEKLFAAAYMDELFELYQKKGRDEGKQEFRKNIEKAKYPEIHEDMPKPKERKLTPEEEIMAWDKKKEASAKMKFHNN
jgi:hypothetical protein